MKNDSVLLMCHKHACHVETFLIFARLMWTELAMSRLVRDETCVGGHEF